MNNECTEKFEKCRNVERHIDLGKQILENTTQDERYCPTEKFKSLTMDNGVIVCFLGNFCSYFRAAQHRLREKNRHIF